MIRTLWRYAAGVLSVILLAAAPLHAQRWETQYFYDQANLKLDQVSRGRVRVKNVTVYETDTTTATYSD